MNGDKFDIGKTDWSVLPWEVLEGVAEVMTYGKVKYNENPDDPNWVKVEGGEHRYFSAGMRHFILDKKGEVYDKESGLEHLKHFMFNMIAYAYFKSKVNSDKFINK